MSIHDDIVQAVRTTLGEYASADILSPTFVAAKTYDRYARDDDAHVKYGAIEHFKQIARRELAGRFDADGERNDAHQHDMFSGHLQDRYPVPVPRGSDPQYRLRELMTRAELAWNVAQLRKSADARVAHADALEAYMESRKAA